MLVDRINGYARRVPTWAIYVAGGVPFVLLVVQAVTGGLGADPVKTLERTLGLHALQFLIATLCISPLRRYAGISLLRFRRALGLLTFWYAALHLTVWITLDLAFRWGEIGTDLVKRPYIIVGMVAFLVLLVLAITSNTWSLRRLGVMWQRLHRFVYLSAMLGAVHFIMLSKVWTTELVVYSGVIVVLLALRFVTRGTRKTVTA